MSQDFVTTLRLQLREAAEREARRGPLRRSLPRTRSLALAGALAAAAVVVVIALGTLGSSAPPPAGAAPHVVARLAIADKGGAMSSGFGSLWTYDSVNGDVLRLSPDGNVLARIKAHSDILDGWAGAGSMWALTDSRLYRIDPKTNRVVARIPLPPPTRYNGGVFPEGRTVWVGSTAGLLHVDLRTNRIDGRVDLEHGGQEARSLAAAPGEIYVLRADGSLATLDSQTGRRLAVARVPVEGFPLGAAGGDVLFTTGAGVAAVDSRSGKLQWRTNLGTSRVNGAAFGPGAIWVQGTPVSGRDQLWKLDPRSGRVLAALPLSDFGVTGMLATRGGLWVMSPNGTLTGIR